MFVFYIISLSNCRIWYSGIFVRVLTWTKASGGLAVWAIIANNLHHTPHPHPPGGTEPYFITAWKTAFKNKYSFFQINQPEWRTVTVRNCIFFQHENIIENPSTAACSPVWFKHLWNTHTHTLVSSGYRECCILTKLIRDWQLVHSLKPTNQLPLTRQSKHLLYTSTHTLTQILIHTRSCSLCSSALVFPRLNYLIYGTLNSWRARAQ